MNEIKERAKKLTENKYFAIIISIIINAIFFVICNVIFTPKYEQIDDFIIMNLISKSDGAYSLYGVQMHPIICGIIILLYKTAININWYTIFLLVMQFMSFTIIGTVFIKKNKLAGLIMYIAFMSAIYSKMLSFIQYTTVSMMCIASGFILLIYSLKDVKNINKFSLIISIIMIVIGCMIRFSTIIIAVPFMILYFVLKILKDKDLKILKISIMLILVILLINISFNIFYNINPVYKKFLEFHDVRTYLHDYNWLDYKGNEDVFNSVNWSKNDRDIFYAYCFGDENFFNIDTLEELEKSAKDNSKTINIFNRCIETFKNFAYYVKVDEMYMFVFWLTVILVGYNNLFIILNKSKDILEEKNKSIRLIFINLSFIGTILMHCLFIFLNRPMFRVIISIYIIEIAILMYLLLDNYNFKINKQLKYISILLILFISSLELVQNIEYAKLYNKDDFQVYREVLDYTSKNKENVYFYTLSIKDRNLAYSIYEKIPDNYFSNVRPLADWDTYTQNYYDFKERYNIENIMESLYKKDNVYLISGKVIWGEEYKEYINIVKKYIKEHYNINVKIKVIKEFEDNIKIYKLTNN